MIFEGQNQATVLFRALWKHYFSINHSNEINRVALTSLKIVLARAEARVEVKTFFTDEKKAGHLMTRRDDLL